MAMNLNQEKDPVASFLQTNRREVPDDGFTKQVMELLPHRYERIALIIRTVGAVAVIALFVIMGGVDVVIDYGKSILHIIETLEWNKAQLHSLFAVIIGLTIVGICNLFSQRE